MADATGIESDPARHAKREQRRDLLFRLQQKYGPRLADVLATRDRSAAELDVLDTADLDLRNLAGDRARAAADFQRACAALTQKRAMGSQHLARSVSELLPALGIASGAFASRLVALPTPHAFGSESVVFEIQLNTGLDARPLAR